MQRSQPKKKEPHPSRLLINTKLNKIGFVSILLCLLSHIAYADDKVRIRLATWNITNFTMDAGKSLFPDRSSPRLPVDLELMEKYFLITDGDVVALQEVDSGRSARQFVGKDYHVYSEQREFDRSRRGSPDLFTAVAVRNTEKFAASAVEELPGLSVRISENGLDTFTRAGIAVTISTQRSSFIFVSIHLKAGCYLSSVFTRPDCLVLRQQFETLRSWLSSKIEAGYRNFVIAGDWNRNFVKLEKKDLLLDIVYEPALQENIPVSLLHGEAGACSVRKNIYDYILVIGDIAKDVAKVPVTTVSPSAYELATGAVLGDHCSIALDLILPK
ncbi:hypothetical protein [Mycoplana rhizolycopersici]|uniref:Endonuclease/exonuclease/phosphatase domain-containing protein n=1 Tax=Mycoplana rhizolycopersici TaxID=2746702 RepID=A0ABX2QGJ7_9HYPH|nr:hypothetical protein [Rhizobium rhizolycopersici]NVP56057.1 hypothetical protein [Rhizobium rhizolycopersici]